MRDADSNIGARVEEFFVRHFAVADDDVRPAEVALEGGAEDIRLLAEIVSVVGDAAVSGEFASSGEFGER